VTDRLLNAMEVAEILCVSRRWVEDATRRGDIPHVRLGRFPRYRPETIALWVEGLEAGSRRMPVLRSGTK
jgi:excisionase family DNA binding protein